MYDLQFEPKTEEELHDYLEIGEGDFEVFKAERTDAKSTGNPMIALILKVWDKNGDQALIYDNLMLTGTKFALRHIRHFCYSCGLENFYESGKLNANDCTGRKGKLKIGFKPESKSKDGKQTYKAKNVVDDYIMIGVQVQEATNGKSKYVPKEEAFDDDIPF